MNTNNNTSPAIYLAVETNYSLYRLSGSFNIHRQHLSEVQSQQSWQDNFSKYLKVNACTRTYAAISLQKLRCPRVGGMLCVTVKSKWKWRGLNWPVPLPSKIYG